MNKFFGELDTYLFHHGTHYKLFDKMGAHLTVENGVSGVHFVLWAPNARAVCVISDGNGWTPWRDNMEKTDDSIWELFVPGMCEGVKYKFLVVRADGSHVEKSTRTRSEASFALTTPPLSQISTDTNGATKIT